VLKRTGLEGAMVKIQSIRERALQSRDAIELLRDKWRIPILHVLTPGRLRASQLQGALPRISAKVLTQTLRGLERDGLISRDVRNAVPAHVEYELTSMGSSVIPLLRNLCRWAEDNSTKRDEARRRFDSSPRKSNGRARIASRNSSVL
jgi:DNA-binding HxlR family transcriptional regulator